MGFQRARSLEEEKDCSCQKASSVEEDLLPLTGVFSSWEQVGMRRGASRFPWVWQAFHPHNFT